jgi:hypothetical protein
MVVNANSQVYLFIDCMLLNNIIICINLFSWRLKMSYIDLPITPLHFNSLGLLNTILKPDSNFFISEADFSKFNYGFNSDKKDSKLLNLRTILSLIDNLKQVSEFDESTLIELFGPTANNSLNLLTTKIVSFDPLNESQIENNSLIPVDEMVVVNEDGSVRPAEYLKVFSPSETNTIVRNLSISKSFLESIQIGEFISFDLDSNSESKIEIERTELGLFLRISSYYSDIISTESSFLQKISIDELNAKESLLNDIYSTMVETNGQLEIKSTDKSPIKEIEESLRISKEFFESDSSFSALVKEMNSDILPLVSTLESKKQVSINIDSKVRSDLLDLDIIKDLIKRMNDSVLNIVDLKLFIDQMNTEIFSNPESRDTFSDLFLGLSEDQQVNVLAKYNKICSFYSSESIMLIKGVNLLAELSPLINGDIFGIVDVNSLTDNTYIETKFVNSPDVSYLLDPNISSPANKGQFAIPFNPMYGVGNYFDCLSSDSNASKLFNSLDLNIGSKLLIDRNEYAVYMKYFQNGDFFNTDPLGETAVVAPLGSKKVFKSFFKFGGAVTFAFDIAKILFIVFTLDSLARISGKLYTEVRKCVNVESSFIDCILKIEFGKVLSDSLSEALHDTKSFIEKTINELSELIKLIASGIWGAIPLPLKIVIGGGLGFGIYRLVSSYAKKDEDDE